ncbi:hypothetical protein V8C34DRAFT_319151 [Trichoderma compactum]
MFGRRRRPVLGAAVLVGASRAAARREVQSQSSIESQQAEMEQRTQRAVDEAMKKAAAENAVSQQSAAVMVSPPPQQIYNTQSPMPIQSPPAQSYTLALNIMPGIHSEQIGRDRPKSEQGIGSAAPAAELNVRYCTQCGFGCQIGDKFCSRCGAKQVS